MFVFSNLFRVMEIYENLYQTQYLRFSAFALKRCIAVACRYAALGKVKLCGIKINRSSGKTSRFGAEAFFWHHLSVTCVEQRGLNDVTP